VTTAAGASRRAHTIGLLAVFGSVMCFSLSFAIIKWPGVPGSALAWWRLIGSSLIWWAMLLVRRHRTGQPLPSRETWRIVLPQALFFGLYISVAFIAVTKTSIAHSQFITALAPLLMMPVGLIFFRERPQWISLRWGLLSLIGIVIVLFNGRGQNTATWSGDLIVVLGVLILAGFMGFSKRSSTHQIDTWESMAIVMPLALVTATPVALGDAGGELWSLGWEAWVAIALLSVLTGVIGHGLMYFAFRSVQVATVSTVQVSQPAFAVFWGWVFLSEAINAKQIPGMVLVIVGIGLVMWFSQRQSSPEDDRGADEIPDASTPVAS
jgi:drug/metabolite transporter (DMT)-like permease